MREGGEAVREGFQAVWSNANGEGCFVEEGREIGPVEDRLIIFSAPIPDDDSW